jgi:hypothetical protein
MKQKVTQWVKNKIEKSKNQPLMKLFLLGVKGQLEYNYPKPYNYHLRILSFIATLAFGKWILSFKRN